MHVPHGAALAAATAADLRAPHLRRRMTASIMRRFVLAAWLLAALAAIPCAVAASCDPGGRPDARDVVAVRVQHHGFPVAREPEFRLEITQTQRYDMALRRLVPQTAATLRAFRTKPVERGTYVLDGDAAALLLTIAEEIQRAEFFTMRFTPTNQMYLEGPSDYVSVNRCAVHTLLATNPIPFQWVDLSDANAQRFFALVDRLGAIVSRERWTRVADPTPAASPSPQNP